ncbi:MAG: sigma-70 family RNA polymerase sigma factor [Rhodospirillaceae bacterium]|nr:sigma-70 family RNA polymerase sigma factor [Rhodospirillaceae bacterium]
MDDSNALGPRLRLEEVILLYEHELRRFLTKHLRNSADIDDCLQETFLKIWTSAQRHELRDDIRGYVFTVALNVIRDKRRRDQARRRDLHTEMSDSIESVRTVGVEDQLYWTEALRLMESELQALRPSTRNIFLKYHLEHKTYADIANELGISVRTVEREIARAMQHMTAVLGNSLFVNDR